MDSSTHAPASATPRAQRATAASKPKKRRLPPGAKAMLSKVEAEIALEQPPAPPAPPAATAAPVSPPTWREQVRDLLPEVQERLENVSEMHALYAGEHGWMAVVLLRRALDLIERHAPILNAGAPDDYDTLCAMPAHANVVAAMHLPDTAMGVPEILEPAVLLLEKISTIAGSTPSKPPAPALPAPLRNPAALKRGIDIYCDMADALKATKHACYFCPSTRWKGTRMNTAAVRDALRAAQESDETLEGFCFAIAGVVAIHEGGELMPEVAEEIRAMPPEWVTEPGTFWNQDDQNSRNEQSPAQAAPAAVASEVEAFMAGKALCADLVVAADAHGGSDEAGLEASYRGKGVPQSVFTMEFLQKIVEQPELLPGFAAALASKLAYDESADELRAPSYEECFGGPGVHYVDSSGGPAVLVADVKVTLHGILKTATAMGADVPCWSDVLEELEKANAAACDADRDANDAADVIEHLHDVRAHVYRARTDIAIAQHKESAQLAADLLALHRRLCDFLGGRVLEDRKGEPCGRLGDLINHLVKYVEAVEHISGLRKSVYDDGEPGDLLLGIQEAWELGDDQDATLRLRELLVPSLTRSLEKCDIRDTWWPLLNVSRQLLVDFLEGDAGDSDDAAEALSGPVRSELSREAACFIACLVEYFRLATHPGTMGDLDAIGQAASVILSAVQDEAENVDSIQKRLESAREMASVKFVHQHGKSDHLVQPQDVGKHFVYEPV